MNTTYIYGLKDPRDSQIYYIGKSNNPDNRLLSHFEDSVNDIKHKWLSTFSKKEKPEIVILEEAHITEWREVERKWIAKAHKDGWPLTNITDGGDGNTGNMYNLNAIMADCLNKDDYDVFCGLQQIEKIKWMKNLACKILSDTIKSRQVISED